MNAKKKMGIKTGDTVVVITGKQAPATVDGKVNYTTGKVTKAQTLAVREGVLELGFMLPHVDQRMNIALHSLVQLFAEQAGLCGLCGALGLTLYALERGR